MIKRFIAVAIATTAAVVGVIAVSQRSDLVGLLIALFAVIFAVLSVAVLNRSGGFEPPACESCGGLIARSAPYCKHCGSPTGR
ncbi:MAG: hypothetical protein M3454_09210 [Actinomycetota bacterium]|nr:hypothetical protein [Actinomycetota bacterium]